MPRPPNPNVRKRLVTEGQRLFLNLGFNATGVQEIALAADVPKGSFYSYFETKEGFAVAVLEEYWLGVERRFGNVLSDSSINPTKRIERYFKALSDDKSRDKYAHGCLIGNLSLELSDSSPVIRAKLAEIFARWEAPIVVCLDEAQAKGEIGAAVKIRDLAATIIECWEGAALRAKVDQRRAAYQRFEEIALARLLR